jgi:hypothetical protein
VLVYHFIVAMTQVCYAAKPLRILAPVRDKKATLNVAALKEHTVETCDWFFKYE